MKYLVVGVLILTACNTSSDRPIYLEDKGTMKANLKLLSCVSKKITPCNNTHGWRFNQCIEKVVHKCGGHIILQTK